MIFALRRASNCWSSTCAGRGNLVSKVSEIRPLGEDCDLADPSLTTSGLALGLTFSFPEVLWRIVARLDRNRLGQDYEKAAGVGGCRRGALWGFNASLGRKRFEGGHQKGVLTASAVLHRPCVLASCSVETPEGSKCGSRVKREARKGLARKPK